MLKVYVCMYVFGYLITINYFLVLIKNIMRIEYKLEGSQLKNFSSFFLGELYSKDILKYSSCM